jgi:hypothetical protein
MGYDTLVKKCLFLMTACLVLVATARGGHTLTAQEQKVLKDWLAQHKQYRLATDQDCDCAGDIEQMKTGYGGLSKPVRDYQFYLYGTTQIRY